MGEVGGKNAHIPGNLRDLPLAKQTRFSPYLQDLDVFCPLRVSLCLANPGRASCCLLTGRSSDQNINGDYSKEKNEFGGGGSFLVGKLSTQVVSFHG